MTPSGSDKKIVPVVFISSTSEDLKIYRAAARDAALDADFQPRMMEYFAASGSKPPLHECLAKVSECDLLIVIVAQRYGWIPPGQPPGESKSITWLECERAFQEKKEILAFFIDEALPWPEEYREEFEITKAIREQKATPALLESIQNNVAQLGKFKSWLDGFGIRKKAMNPESLRGAISNALHQWRSRPQRLQEQKEAAPGPSLDPAKYLQDLLRDCRYIEIRGLQVGTMKVHKYPIEELYISLTTTLDAETGDKGKAAKKPAAELSEPGRFGRNAVPLQAALTRSPLVVIGDPGSGKTTFLKYIACALCQTLLKETPNAAEARLSIKAPRLPILVRLADLADYIIGLRENHSSSRPVILDDAAWLPNYLAALSKAKDYGLDEGFFLQKLRSGECIVLFDGLDEAPVRIERPLVSRLIESIAKTYSRCGMVVTSRPAAYAEEVLLPGFTHVWIDPLDQQGIRSFLSRWCNALYSDDPSGATAHCKELTGASASPEIRAMVRNPVMLTALAVIYWNEKRIPEQRADLYDSILRWLSRSREEWRGRTASDRCLSLLTGLALAMQMHPEERKVQVPGRWAAEAIAGELEPGKRITRQIIEKAGQYLAEEENDSGIIVERGNEVRYWHLTFQEYLAAKAIGGEVEKEQKRILFGPPKRLYLPEWREVMNLLAHVLHQQGKPKVDYLFGIVLDDLGNMPRLADQARCAGLLGAMLRDLKPVKYEPSDPRYPRLLEDVLGIFDARKSESISVNVRLEAAEALGQTGDPRLEQDNWSAFKSGSFLMGSQKEDPSKPNYDPDRYDWEMPVHQAQVEAFQISKYPVTVFEYRKFVESGGYDDMRFWKTGGFGETNAPEKWEEQVEFPNRPVVGVNWYEASAYCAWKGVRLPTEEEWEFAARGKDGRKYPWGNDPASSLRLNYSESQIGRPSPVGLYPLGMTPEGIADMAGNVWEWMESLHDRKSKKFGANRVLRGGGWAYVARFCRSAYRLADHPAFRYDFIGFRPARSLPASL